MSDQAIVSRNLRAVVTGASSGIGRQIALELARSSAAAESGSANRDSEACRLIVHYCQNRDGAEETANAVRSLGAEAEIVQADLCIDADRKRLVSECWSLLGEPTTWVNNAGADVLTGERAGLSFTEKLRLLFETDVFGTIELSRSVASRLIEQSSDRGPELLPPSMTFIGWDQAPLGMEGDAGQLFGPVKAAVMAFAKSLAQEVAPHIRVNTVAPGWIQTAWGQTTSGVWDARAKNQSLMHRWGRPADVAKAVCFVADPANTFCTGQTIDVNGGWNRRSNIGSIAR